jgi:23S rRNA (cytosine1962-C5)-methyltransferase
MSLGANESPCGKVSTATPRARVRVTKPLRDALRAGHPWIYDRAIGAASGATTGDVVTLVDDRGPLAAALFDPGSPIGARVLDLDPEAACDGTWAAARAEAAARVRARDPLLAGCTGVRLVHGEADGCPGLVIDAYADTAVVVFDGPAAAAFWRARLTDVLAGLERAGSPLAHVWMRGGRRRGRDAGAGEAIRGDPPAEIVIAEDEARFGVDVRAGQKTGFFLDQRDNRRTIRHHAAGQSVLNLFAYTGGFSLHAALGGATRVTSVDVAAPAIAAIERNLAHAQLPADAHERVAADAFEFLARAHARGRRWDLVIADPPSFAPSERAKPSALRAYGKLAAAALGVVEPGGRFAFASCSSHVTETDLLNVIAATPAPALRLRLAAGAASDHPVLAGFGEGRYLKFLFFDVG